LCSNWFEESTQAFKILKHQHIFKNKYKKPLSMFPALLNQMHHARAHREPKTNASCFDIFINGTRININIKSINCKQK